MDRKHMISRRAVVQRLQRALRKSGRDIRCASRRPESWDDYFIVHGAKVEKTNVLDQAKKLGLLHPWEEVEPID